jgi:hypothetical protein
MPFVCLFQLLAALNAMPQRLKDTVTATWKTLCTGQFFFRRPSGWAVCSRGGWFVFVREGPFVHVGGFKGRGSPPFHRPPQISVPLAERGAPTPLPPLAAPPGGASAGL